MHVEDLGEARDTVEVALRLWRRPGFFWLDGEGPGTRENGFSYLGSDPLSIVETPSGDRDGLEILDLIEARTAERRGLPEEIPVPRWIGYLSFDTDPAAWFAEYDAVIRFDHETGAATLVGDSALACAQLRARLAGHALRPKAVAGVVQEASPIAHLEAIRSALDLIARGEIYQVNLARRWTVALKGDAFALALAMRRTSPVPFGFYLDAGSRKVCGRSMERFLDWNRSTGRLVTRPIKGTVARRGAQDRAEARELRADPKEQAEHAMIVDLMRNDLSRVAQLGSVRVDEVMAVEPYAKLHHLVSTVSCRTRSTATMGEVLRATFPPGSVTGTPKIRAVEVIRQLEPVARGPYTGCAGFISRSGDVSFAVSIRTAVMENGDVSYFAGGGIVEASIPEKELAETELKARVFIEAIASLSGGRLTPAQQDKHFNVTVTPG